MVPIRCSAKHRFISVLWFPFVRILDRGVGWPGTTAVVSPPWVTSFVFFNTSAMYCAPMCVILGCASNSMVPLVAGGHLFDKFISFITEFFDIIVAMCIAAISVSRLLPSHRDSRFGCFPTAWNGNKIRQFGVSDIGGCKPCSSNEHRRQWYYCHATPAVEGLYSCKAILQLHRWCHIV